QGSGDAVEKRNKLPPSKIEALDGSNYEEWSGRIRSAFKRYKLLKLAMGEEKMSEEGDARDRWIEKSMVLYDVILQSGNNDMFQHIKDLVELDDSGPKAWKLLRDVIQPNTLPVVIVLEKELAALSMRPGDDVKPDNLIPTLNTQQDQWTPEWLRQQILQEDFRRCHTGGGAANKTAEGYGAAGGSRGRGGGRFQGRGRGFGRGRGRGDYNEGHGSSGGRGSTRMEGACWYCKKAGHPWFKCFSRPQGWAPPGMKPPSGERARGGAVQGSGAQGSGAQGKANPGMFLMEAAEEEGEGEAEAVGEAEVTTMRGMGALGWAPPGMKPPSGERARGGAVQGSGAQGSGAQGKANPGMFLMVEDVKGSEGDVGSVGKVVMHPLTHWVIDSGCTSHMTPRADLLDECFSRPEGWAPPGMKPPSGERARGGAVQGLGAQGKANPGMFLMVEDVKGSEGDVGSVGKVVMHPLTHWVIDSGCTSHMTPRADLLDEVKPPGKIKFVAATSGALLPVIGVGNAKLPCKAWEIAAVGFGGEEQLHQGPMAAAHHPLEWETTSNGSGSSNG
ncbi:unnamed protein product, partial [Closterium sp. NIES-54]